MGMRIGSVNSNRTTTKIKKADGTVVGTITISKPKPRKKKRLSYNFKKISNQIMLSRTSVNAGKALTKARGTVIMLTMKQRSSEYDEKELKDALEHAKEMTRIAKKRKRHMEEEERAEQGKCLISEGIEENSDEEDFDKAEEELSAEELQELAKEYRELMEESVKDSLKEMADELISTVHEDMSDDEIDELKKKHRADELRRIMLADMKYLKALFEKLQKEKQQSSSASKAVALEIAGVEVPVPVTVEETPVAAPEGGNVDVSV